MQLWAGGWKEAPRNVPGARRRHISKKRGGSHSHLPLLECGHPYRDHTQSLQSQPSPQAPSATTVTHPDKEIHSHILQLIKEACCHLPVPGQYLEDTHPENYIRPNTRNTVVPRVSRKHLTSLVDCILGGAYSVVFKKSQALEVNIKKAWHKQQNHSLNADSKSSLERWSTGNQSAERGL